ncbi:MAG: hypothetical protein ACRCX4_01470 [Bacteroidales bacterium]
MKKLNLLSILIFCIFSLHAQTNTSEHGFVFPLGCRAVLQIDPATKSGICKYTVIYFEEFPEVIDTYDNENIFFKNAPKNTIQVIFTVSTHGKERNEVEKNYRTSLFIKSNYAHKLKYKADILRTNATDFSETSVMPVFNQVKTVELWPYLIQSIALYDFEIIPQSEVEKSISLKTAHDNQ